MSSVHDVAAYILSRLGTLPAMKLQKLAYYAQAWTLVWQDRPLFEDKIEAWANGPVVPELYSRHRGQYRVSEWKWGHVEQLSEMDRNAVDAVLAFYGDKGSQWLSELTHSEAPWIDARKGLAPGERGNQEITFAAMAEYYGSL